MKTILNFCLLLALALGARAQTISVSWNAVPGATDYQLGVGTNAGSYPLTQTVVGTNGTLQLGSLTPGANYIAVRAHKILTPTNAITSAFGVPVVVTIVQAPAARLSATFDTSTNLIAWTGGGPTANAIVSEDQSIQFFKVRSTAIETVASADAPPDPIGYGTLQLFPPTPPQ